MFIKIDLNNGQHIFLFGQWSVTPRTAIGHVIHADQAECFFLMFI